MVECRPLRRDSTLADRSGYGAGLRAALGELRRLMEAAGRDASERKIVPIGVLPDPDKLDDYASLGVGEAVLRLASAGREAVMPTLDDFTQYLSNHSQPTAR